MWERFYIHIHILREYRNFVGSARANYDNKFINRVMHVPRAIGTPSRAARVIGKILASLSRKILVFEYSVVGR